MSGFIHINQINKSFRSEDGDITQVLFDVTADVLPGELTLLVGPSGCGKTTLISIIAGILSADSGAVDLFGTPILSLSDSQKTHFRRGHVGFVFQQLNLVPTLTVAENVAMPLIIQGIPEKEALKRASRVLHDVQLEGRDTAFINQLSGGQQQRVAIARALVSEPRLLICDEPTASLDGQNGRLVMELIKSLALTPDASGQANRCVIIVTHDNRVFNLGDRMIRMEDGRIQEVCKITDSLVGNL